MHHKRLPRLLPALSLPLALAAPAAAQGSFEGAVTFSQTAGLGKPPLTAHSFFKGPSMRTETDLDLPQVPGIKTIVLMDMATGSVISLVPGQKVYMVTSIREAPAGTIETEQARLSATGKKETVAGVSCEHHVMALGDGELDYCAAKGMGYGAGGSGAPALPSWDEWRKRYPEGFFVLKIEQVLGGKRDVMIEAKQIERKKLPDALFVPPPGYTEMKPGRDGRQ